MPESTSWARLRQVILATDDLDSGVAALRETFGLEQSFADPELAEHGLVDATFPVGADGYLQVISPLSPDHPVNRWLTKVGGAGGYCLSVQVPDVEGCRRRAAECGVRVAVEVEAQAPGWPGEAVAVVQLHPKDVGVLLELDGLTDRDRWFWDAITPGPSEGAVVDAVLGVEIGVAEPERMAQTWAAILDLPLAAPTTVDLGGAVVAFVPGSGMREVVLRGAAPPVDLLGVHLRTG